MPLIVAGPTGWGDAVDGRRPVTSGSSVSCRPTHKRALFAAADVFAYPSELEGFGLPVLEAMAQGAPVVTSRGTSTEEVAGGAAVLVDPFDVDAIADGIDGGAGARDGAGRGRQAPRRGDVVGRHAPGHTLAVYHEAVPRG